MSSLATILNTTFYHGFKKSLFKYCLFIAIKLDCSLTDLNFTADFLNKLLNNAVGKTINTYTTASSTVLLMAFKIFASPIHPLWQSEANGFISNAKTIKAAIMGNPYCCGHRHCSKISSRVIASTASLWLVFLIIFKNYFRLRLNNGLFFFFYYNIFYYQNIHFSLQKTIDGLLWCANNRFATYIKTGVY